MNYWYFERPDEILLDCDLGFNHADAAHVLRIWKREIGLEVTIKHVYASRNPGHKHVVIETPRGFPVSHKRLIALMLGSDRHREIISLGQWLRGFQNAYLVVSPRQWPGRPADFTCTCTPCDRDNCPHFEQIQRLVSVLDRLITL